MDHLNKAEKMLLQDIKESREKSGEKEGIGEKTQNGIF
jgi:hypothetical protein